MIRNWPALLLVAWAAFGCQPTDDKNAGKFQGVVEYEERVLAFELGGRVENVSVERGDVVKKDQTVASLDDSLEKTAREARASEVSSARSQVELLQAGTRPDEIRAMAAQVRAARATEARIRKNLVRERELTRRGVSAPALVDDLGQQLSAAIAQRQSLEHRLRSLRRGARSQEIDSAKSRATALEKGLDLETERVARHILSTPSDGAILDVHVKSGEVVAPGTPVATLGDTQHPYADVFVPIGQLDGIRVGAPATLSVDASTATFAAKVEHVARNTEFTPRYLFSERERPNLVVRVRLRIEDPDQSLHAGVPAFADITRGAP